MGHGHPAEEDSCTTVMSSLNQPRRSARNRFSDCGTCRECDHLLSIALGWFAQSGIFFHGGGSPFVSGHTEDHVHRKISELYRTETEA